MPAHIHLLGTSHIADSSVKQLRRAFDEHNPSIVAVELDRYRLHGLLSGAKPSANPAMIRHVGITGYLFGLIGMLVQRYLGRLVGMQPGSEMLAAVQLARERGARIALVDRDVRITLRRLRLSWRERGRILYDLLFGWASRERVRIDLRSVPSQRVIDGMMGQLRTRYPSIYRVLVVERNTIIARRLDHLARHHDGVILAVLGAGHVHEVRRLLERFSRENHINARA